MRYYIFLAVCFCFLLLLAFLYIGVNKSQTAPKGGRFEREICRYELLSRETPPTSQNTMFLGSSNFALWGSDLEKRFEQFHAVNRALDGAHTTDLLFALDRLVLPYNPNRIVVFIGGNDIAFGAEPAIVFENFKQILEKIWTANPESEVFFVSPTHAPCREAYWKKMDVYDEKVFDLAQKQEKLHHIDITRPMNDAQGNVRKELYLSDGLHLNEAGRDIWVHLITAAIEKCQESVNQQQ